MVRSGVLSQATLGGKHLSAYQVLAPRGDPLRETRLNLPRFLNTRVLNRLHQTPINQHALDVLAIEQLTNKELLAAISRLSAQAYPTKSTSEELEAYLSMWSQRAPSECLRWMQTRPPGKLFLRIMGQIFFELATDSSTAASAYNSLATQLERDIAFQFITQRTQSLDPRSAIATLIAIDKDAARSNIERVLIRWAEASPEEAIQYLAESELVGSKSTLLSKCLLTWFAKAPDKALAHLYATPGGASFQRQLIHDIIASGNALPNSTLLGLLAVIQHPRDRGPLQNYIADQWARTDSAGALAWASSISTASERNAALLAIATSRLRVAPDDAQAILGTITGKSEREQLISSYANVASLTDATGSWQWAESSLHGSERLIAKQAILSNWASHNPEDALQQALSTSTGLEERDSLVMSVLDGFKFVDGSDAANMARATKWLRSAKKEDREYLTRFAGKSLNNDARTFLQLYFSASNFRIL